MENNKNTRLCGMLGFAMRAGKVIIGTELVCTALSRRGKDAPRIVLISATASDGTRKKILNKCAFYGVKQFTLNMTGDELGHLLGKLYSPAVVAITDDGFASEIEKALGTEVSDAIASK